MPSFPLPLPFPAARRSVRRVLWSAACLSILSGCAAGSYLGYRIHPDYPRSRTETLPLPGLEAPVTVHLDTFGIPHIEAQNERDLLRATGYMQARQRFFAMDAMRRLARGRISELVGEQPLLGSTTVQFDRAMRGWGFDAEAEQDAAAVDPELHALLAAYVEGINTALLRHRPLEYRLLRVDPEPWRIADSFALGRLNAWSVAHNWHQETSRLLLAIHGGLERSQRLYGDEPWKGMTSLPGDREPQPLAPAVVPELEGLFPGRSALLGPEPSSATTFEGPGRRLAAATAGLFEGASNAWVVSGERSVTGHPLLANDPHLAHLLPSLLYQQSLRAPGIAVIGAGIAGVPYVLAGHNGKVAWGMTAAVADAQDLVIEHPDGQDRVRTPTGSAPIVSEEHIIRVRDGRRFREARFTFRSTPHGPLLNDFYPDIFPPDAPLVALRSVPSCSATSLKALRLAAEAGNVFELRAALLSMGAPPQVWQAVDDTGHIALFVTGTLPLRRGYRGTFPVPGWLGDYGWDGFVPAEEMPFHVSKSGFLAHANNLTIDPRQSSVHLGVDSAPAYRQERILALLAAQERHSADDMRRMHIDRVLERARRLVPLMLASLSTEDVARDLTPLEQRAVAVLARWNYDATVDSAGAAIFFSLYRQAVLMALEDELDDAGLDFVLAQRYSMNAFDLWFDDEHHPAWDDRRTDALETRTTVLRSALALALEELTASQGEDPEQFRWGALHDLEIRHLFGGQRALARYVNLPRLELGGGPDAIWKSHFDLGNRRHPFRAMAGPVLRMVVDAADFDRAGFVLDTGNSGWPGCPHYRDQHELWKRGELVPMTLDREAVAEGAVATLTLLPQ